MSNNFKSVLFCLIWIVVTIGLVSLLVFLMIRNNSEPLFVVLIFWIFFFSISITIMIFVLLKLRKSKLLRTCTIWVVSTFTSLLILSILLPNTSFGQILMFFSWGLLYPISILVMLVTFCFFNFNAFKP